MVTDKGRCVKLANTFVVNCIILFCLSLCMRSCTAKCVSSGKKSTKTNILPLNDTAQGRALEQTCYRGDCIEEECECDPGWTGEYCDRCGGRVLLTDDSGFVSDGPHHYATERECSWLIRPTTRNSPIRLTFLEFASECGWDYLYVYDGDSAYAPLLATFNGLVQNHDPSKDTYHPEVVASSGYAFIHFFSDIAYTMQGFNISYTVQECPQQCMGHGICKTSGPSVYCQCDVGWTGDACEHLVCPSNCSESLDQGTCTNNSAGTEQMCGCNPGYQGLDCSASIPPKEGFAGEEQETKSIFNTARASHAAVLLKNTMWVFGGIQFENLSNANELFTYDVERKQWAIVEPVSPVQPVTRYGHSLVTYEGKLWLFGGRELLSDEILDELWAFDIINKTWLKIEYTTDFWNSTDNSTSPLTLWGHTSTFVNFLDKPKIIVLFGFHPVFEYSGFVFEYDIRSSSWTIAQTTGASIKASYGHAAAWDSVNRVIIIHGGFKQLEGRSFGIDDGTYSYDPEKKLFILLKSSGVPRYLHTAVVSGGILYVYGGCTHNDSDKSTGALCFSPSFMAYKLSCNTWEHLSSLDGTYLPNRYGHSAIIMPAQNDNDTSKMLLYGGYDSITLENILFYQTPSCSAFHGNKTECVGQDHTDLLCAWNGTLCVEATHRHENSSCALSPISRCSSIDGCSSCVSTFEGCAYCDNKCNSTCISGKSVTDSSDCSDVVATYCSRYHSCSQCQLTSQCHWDVKNGCVSGTVDGAPECDVTCGMRTPCSDCLGKSDCMWCANKGVCVSTTSYVVQFPYGECMKWVNKKTQCDSAESCTSQRTCTNCQSNPFCGWCDDGSETGLGRCQSGTGSGSHDGTSSNILANGNTVMYNASIPSCLKKSWYFAECPLCQCNGHSKCIDDTSECESCQNKTTGDQCETCVDGFFGDATNGGQCQLCNCDGRAALCNNTSGKCFCSTKGEIGDKCEKCDNNAKYYGDPSKNGTCFYRLLINYSFTFTLTANKDEYVTAINFENTPPLTANAQLSFEAQQLCNIRLAVYLSQTTPDKQDNETVTSEQNEDGGYEIEVAEYLRTSKFSFDFSGSKFGFGDQSTNATIRIYVQNFTIPTWIQVSLVQRSNSLLVLLLILFSCFLVILLLTAVAWKLKMLYDACQLRRQRAEQLEQMAARPFSTVHLDFDNLYDSKQALTMDSTIEVMSEELCQDGAAAAVSVIFWMPSGNLDASLCVDEDKSMNSVVSELSSENAALAFGTALISSSGRLATTEPELAAHGTSAQSHAKKLKVVFKRGRRRASESRPPSRQSTGLTRTSLHQDTDQRPHARCGTQNNQSNNVPDRIADVDSAPGAERPRPQMTTRGRRRSSKRGRASFTSIRSGSVSPASPEARYEGFVLPDHTRREPSNIVLAYDNPGGDGITV